MGCGSSTGVKLCLLRLMAAAVASRFERKAERIEGRLIGAAQA